MTPPRTLSWGILLVGIVVGCDSPARLPHLVPEGHSDEQFQRAFSKSQVAASEAAATRALKVAQRIYDANTHMPLKPTLMTIGRPEKAIFHEGASGLTGSRIYITEGLIDACKTDDQLAAVLCVQLGRMMAEHAERSAGTEEDKGRLTIDERIGRESDRGFGSADGTRMMEIAKRQKMARERRLKADPTQCAETYLRRTDYSVQALLEVSALLLQIESNEETMREAVAPLPTRGKPPTVPGNQTLPPPPPDQPASKAASTTEKSSSPPRSIAFGD